MITAFGSRVAYNDYMMEDDGSTYAYEVEKKTKVIETWKYV